MNDPRRPDGNGRQHVGTCTGSPAPAEPGTRRRPRAIVYREEGRLELYVVDAPDGLELSPEQAAELGRLLLAAAEKPTGR